MENTKNISSEQELLELLNEGKINEDEYHDLLGTLQRRPHAESGNVASAGAEPARTSGLAIASIVLALALGPFGVLPAIICGHVALRKIERDPSLTGRALALAGLIAGYSILGLTIVISVPILLPLLAYQRAEISRPLSADVVVLRQYALNDTQGLITQSGIGIDKQISSDGNGSLRIEAAEPTTIRLFETGEMDIENARLIYQARVRTENVVGQVYLEMWCHFPVGGEFFSRGLVSSLTGTTDWTTLETPFMLKKGQEPDNVKLNLVINGHGTVWIDDIRLLKGPFE
jgi:F0F1-type ATP synthase membrane subunit c/vacuolar-type H+-ATPase subunit K